MKKYHQSNLIKNLKLISLLCFLFLGLAGCKGNQLPQIGEGTDTTSSEETTPTQQQDQNQDQNQDQDQNNDNGRSDIASRLTAPNINFDSIAGSLFSIGSNLQIAGYQILYQVEIASDDAFANVIYNEHISVQELDVSGTTYYIPDFANTTWPTLVTGQTYHIRVRRVARKQGEQDIVGAYSDATEFTAPDLTCFTPVPQTTTLTSSEQSHVLNFSVHATNLSCDTSALLINSHEIEVASDNAFSNIEQTGTMSHQVTLSNFSDLSRDFTLTNKLSNGTYYWRVRNRVILENNDVIVGPYSSGTQVVVSQ